MTMYIPEQYSNENITEVREFIRANPFGLLVNQVNGRPWATHIPFELTTDQDGGELLVGHISKANMQWKSFGNGQVLCVFNGPHSYVSSSWYRQEEVPTWDYIAVHVYGTLRLQSDTELHQSLDMLVNRYEKASKKPVRLSELSKKTLKQMRAVVGFEVVIEEIQAAYKLSQGRPSDHAAIISELLATGDPDALAVARAIEMHGKQRPK